MGSRCLSVLALLMMMALVPAPAFADRHPGECLVGASFSKSGPEIETATTGEEDDDLGLRRSSIACSGLLLASTGVVELGGAGGYSVEVVPAAVADGDLDGVNEFMFGTFVYLNKWRHIQPTVRVLVGGVTTTSDDERHGASSVGLGFDVRWPAACPANRFLGAICKVVRLGARLSGDLVVLHTQPKQVIPRFTVRAGLRIERGKHRDHP